jgi:hypothetical protein
MTVTIELPSDIEAGLLAQAQAEGLAVSDYLQHFVLEKIAAKMDASGWPGLPTSCRARSGFGNSPPGQTGITGIEWRPPGGREVLCALRARRERRAGLLMVGFTPNRPITIPRNRAVGSRTKDG